MLERLPSKNACFGCAACEASCGQGAISMQLDAEGFPYPVVNQGTCIECGSCARVCSAVHDFEGEPGSAFAVKSTDVELLELSSSGGAFTLLAQQVLEQDGLVCGATFDEGFVVCHMLSSDISRMRKSKYVQSDMTGMYEAVQEALDQGRKVLFTGTPCQCDGMRRYFGLSENLILAALICRGVQSPGLWADYVAYLGQDGVLDGYDFRDKRAGDDGHVVSYVVDGVEHALRMAEDAFTKLYIKCLTLRPSCYACPYTTPSLPFDITFGDFWGVEDVYPELNDGMGTSLVIARSEKALELLEGVRTHAVVLESDMDACMQEALTSPAKETLLRRFLFKDYANKDAQGHCDIALILKKYGA